MTHIFLCDIFSCADELFQKGNQVFGNTKQNVSISEQDMVHDVA